MIDAELVPLYHIAFDWNAHGIVSKAPYPYRRQEDLVENGNIIVIGTTIR